MSNLAEEVLTVLKENPASLKQIAEELHRELDASFRANLSRCLNGLKREGKVTCEATNKQGTRKWKLNTTNTENGNGCNEETVTPEEKCIGLKTLSEEKVTQVNIVNDLTEIKTLTMEELINEQEQDLALASNDANVDIPLIVTPEPNASLAQAYLEDTFTQEPLAVSDPPSLTDLIEMLQAEEPQPQTPIPIPPIKQPEPCTQYVRQIEDTPSIVTPPFPANDRSVGETVTPSYEELLASIYTPSNNKHNRQDKTESKGHKHVLNRILDFLF